MTDHDRTNDAAAEAEFVDALLTAVAEQPDAALGEDFTARLLADAALHLPEPPAMAVALAEEAPGWRGWVAALGGWPMLGGLMAAGVCGLWIGVAPPAALDAAIAEIYGGSVSVDISGLSDPFGLEG